MLRPKHLFLIVLVVLVFATCLAACDTEDGSETIPTPRTSGIKPFVSSPETEAAYKAFVANLEKMNFAIVAEDVEKSIFKGQRKWLTLNESEELAVYLYADKDDMEKDASFISDDGFFYNDGSETTIIQWESDPHFFKSENMIVLYVGTDSKILDALEDILGEQFAGITGA